MGINVLSEFDVFADEFEAGITSGLQTAFPGAEIRRQYVKKLQGGSYDALIVTVRGGSIGINLDLQRIYEEKEKAGSSMEEAVADAIDLVKSRIDSVGHFDPEIITDYSRAKSRLMLEAVPLKGNADMLKDMPHRVIEDLALIYRISVRGGTQCETTLVHNGLLKEYGITAEQLHEDAMENAPEMCPAEIMDLPGKINEISESIPGSSAEGCVPELTAPVSLYFVGTRQQTFGAAAIFYPGMMERCAAFLGGNYFIIPSSIHEVLIVKDNGDIRPEELAKMISEINESIVDPEDRLADHAYYYDAGRAEFRSA